MVSNDAAPLVLSPALQALLCVQTWGKSTVSTHHLKEPELNIKPEKLWSNSEIAHECSGSLSQSLKWTGYHFFWSMWGASFIAGWLGWKDLCAAFRATVVFSCGLLVKWDWLLGSNGQKPAGDHYYCWKNIAPCHRMVDRDTHTKHGHMDANTWIKYMHIAIYTYTHTVHHNQRHKSTVSCFFPFLLFLHSLSHWHTYTQR